MNFENLNTGDIILIDSSPKKTIRKFIVKQIKNITETNWNHAGILVKFDEQMYIFEAEKKGLRFVGIDYYINNEKNNILILKPNNPLDDIEKYMIRHRALEMVGMIRYDFANLLLHQLIRFLYRKNDKELWIGKKGIKANKRMTCSELAAYMYFFIRDYFKNYYKLAPIDLYDSELFNERLYYNKDRKDFLKYDYNTN